MNWRWADPSGWMRRGRRTLDLGLVRGPWVGFAAPPLPHGATGAMEGQHVWEQPLHSTRIALLFQGPMGPDWPAFFALFSSEAKIALTKEELLAGPGPPPQELRLLTAATLALIKHGLPIPPGPMCEFWVPVNRVVKSLIYAKVRDFLYPVNSTALLTMGVTARDHRSGKALFQVKEVDRTWWIRANPQASPPATIGPYGEMAVSSRTGAGALERGQLAPRTPPKAPAPPPPPRKGPTRCRPNWQAAPCRKT